MAMLLFSSGATRFALNCLSIWRVVPLVQLHEMPDSPACVAGLLMLKGENVPVIDFCRLFENRPAHPYWSTRIALIKSARAGHERIIGILGEKMDEIIDLKVEEFNVDEYYLARFPYLAKGLSNEQGMIHLIDIDRFFASSEVLHIIGHEPSNL